MSIEKHQCEGGDFHTTTDFLDCEECEAIIPNIPNEKGYVVCLKCGTAFLSEQIADARVEEIVEEQNARLIPPNCVAIGESRMLELEEKERRYDELHEHWLRLIGTKVALCYVLEKWRERIEWAPEAYAPMTRDLILQTDAVLEVKRGPTPATTQPGDDGECSWIVELTVPAACVANGFEITKEVAFHMLASHADLVGAELKTKIVAAPKQDRIHNLQCGKEDVE